jgi:O-antigen ligase
MGASVSSLLERFSLRRPAQWLLALAAVALSADLAIRMSERTGGKMVLLALVPLLVAVLYLLLTRAHWLLLAILAGRASLDPVFVQLLSGAEGGLTPSAAVNALAIMVGAVLVLLRPQGLQRGFVLIWLPFVALLLLAFRIAPDAAKATRMLMQYLSYLTMFCSAALLIQRRSDAKPWLITLLLASVIPTVLGFVDLFSGGVQPVESADDEPVDLDALVEETGFRIQGAFAHPNIYAFFLLTIIGVLVYTLKSGLFAIGPLARIAMNGYLLIQLVMLMATQTRSAWAVCGFMFLAYGLFIERRYLLYLLFAPVLAALFVPSVRDRVADLLTGSGNSSDGPMNSYGWRIQMWKSAATWIQEKWLFGWGLDTYTEYSPIFFPLEFIKAHDAHNVYVQLAFELGIPGAVAFTLVFLLMAAIAVSRLTARPLESVMLLVGSVGYMMVCYSDNMHRYLVSNWYTFFWLGLLCVLTTMPRTRDRLRP